MKAVRELGNDDLNALVARLLGWKGLKKCTLLEDVRVGVREWLCGTAPNELEQTIPQWSHDPVLALELMSTTGAWPERLFGQIYWVPARREYLAVFFPRDGDLIQEFAPTFARAAVLAWVAWRLSC